VLGVFTALVLTFISFMLVHAGGVCISLFLAFSFAILGGVKISNNHFCLHKMKFGELNKTFLFNSGYNK